MPDDAQTEETEAAEIAAATIWKLLSASEDGFTRLVAPLLVAFTLPTIAVIVTTRDLPGGAGETWRGVVLALLIASTGFLLAGIQLAVGTLSKPNWSGITRASLTYCGLIALTLGLIGLVLPVILRSTGPLIALWAGAVLVLVLGVGIPAGLQLLAKIVEPKPQSSATSESPARDT